MLNRSYLIRNINAGDLLEVFLVTAAATVLTVRFFLYITHYPQIGGHGFHIAHMLWGGLLMLIALVLLLSFLSNTLLRVGAIIGGMGFGLFIDELGKFITRDNNYFFQPTIAIIYIIFISLFLIFRSLEKQQKLTKKEYLMNALQVLEEAVLQNMDSEEKRQADTLLQKSNPKDPLVIHLKAALELIELIPPQKPSSISRIRTFLRKKYHFIINSSKFARFITLFFIAKSIFPIIALLLLLLFFATTHALMTDIFSQLTFTQLGQLISSTFSFLFVIWGVIQIRRSRYYAYLMFKRSILISIFMTQFFAFYREQLSAITGLIINVIILIILQYMIDQEKLFEEMT